jgi:6-phosphofructokinase 2
MRTCSAVPQFATITPSPPVGISASVEHIAPFGKLRRESVRYDPGGGGNVARALKRFGANPRALIPVGLVPRESCCGAC